MPLTALALSLAADAVKPHPAIRPPSARYASENYELAFPTPRNVWVCPFPDDWTGTDHGTTLFLAPPRYCSGVGFSSDNRGFEGPTTPRIELYYDRTLIPDGIKPFTKDPCRKIGTIRLFGRPRPLCAAKSRWGMTMVSVASLYKADWYEMRLTLVTTRTRYKKDLATLTAFAATIGTCDQNRTKGARVCNGTY